MTRNGRRYTILQPARNFRADGVAWVRRIPYYVQDGMWVWEYEYSGASMHFIGPGAANVKEIKLDRTDLGWARIYVSTQPFGVLIGGYELGDGHRLFCARQVHKAQLGRSPSGDPKLTIAREAPNPAKAMDDVPRGRNQKRNHICWASLASVIEASGLTPKQVLLGYWPFVGRSFDETNSRFGTLLHITWAADVERIRATTGKHTYHTENEIHMIIDCGEGLLAEVWIRAGFAKTILRLLALGVKPFDQLPA